MTHEDLYLSLIDRIGPGREIGPCHHPVAPKVARDNVGTVDHLCQAEQNAKYAKPGAISTACVLLG